MCFFISSFNTEILDDATSPRALLLKQLSEQRRSWPRKICCIFLLQSLSNSYFLWSPLVESTPVHPWWSPWQQFWPPRKLPRLQPRLAQSGARSAPLPARPKPWQFLCGGGNCCHGDRLGTQGVSSEHQNNSGCQLLYDVLESAMAFYMFIGQLRVRDIYRYLQKSPHLQKKCPHQAAYNVV